MHSSPAIGMPNVREYNFISGQVWSIAYIYWLGIPEPRVRYIGQLHTFFWE